MKIKNGDFCFVTVFGRPPKVLERENDAGRLAWLQDNLPDIAGDVILEDVERANFPRAVHKIIIAAYTNAFAPRRDGRFIPLLQIKYPDSLPMITVGGAFLVEGQAGAYRDRVKSAMPFLNTAETQLYEIRSLHLTERERGLFDRAVTATVDPSPDRTVLEEMGFGERDFVAYQDLIRYLPRYVETMV